MTMQVELENYIEQKVAHEEYRSRDEFLEAAICMYRDLEEFEELRSEVGRRVEEARQGRVASLDIARLKIQLLAKWQTSNPSAS